MTMSNQKVIEFLQEVFTICDLSEKQVSLLEDAMLKFVEKLREVRPINVNSQDYLHNSNCQNVLVNTNLLRQLMSTDKEIHIYNTYISGNNNNVNYNSNNVVNKKGKKSAKKTLKTFYEYLYSTRPEWYLEGKLVSINTIEDAYREYFDDKNTNIAVISKNLNGGLFTAGSRSGGVTKKRLVPFDTLKTLF